MYVCVCVCLCICVCETLRPLCVVSPPPTPSELPKSFLSPDPDFLPAPSLFYSHLSLFSVPSLFFCKVKGRLMEGEMGEWEVCTIATCDHVTTPLLQMVSIWPVHTHTHTHTCMHISLHKQKYTHKIYFQNKKRLRDF